MNHQFQTCETGAISRYAAIEETLAPLLLETIEQWLQQQRCTNRYRSFAKREDLTLVEESVKLSA